MQRSGCGCAQRMHHQAGIEPRAPTLGYVLRGCPHAVGGGGKAALVVAQGWLLKAGTFVQGGHQRHADTRGLRRIGQGPAEGQRIGIGLAIGRVLQVVELADLGVAALQQLKVQLGGDGLQLPGRDAKGHAVHAVAPGPEVIGLAFAPLGQAGKGALEGMAVGIDQARQDRPVQHQGAGRRLLHTGLHRLPAPVAADAEQHICLPAAGQPGLWRPQQVGCGVRHRVSNPGRFAARRAAGVGCALRAAGPAPKAGLRPCRWTSTSPTAPRARPARAGRRCG